MLELLATAVLSFGAVWAFLKLVYEPHNTEHLKAQSYIRELEFRGRQIDAGINPDGLPYDFDHSSDYHNQGCKCEQCERIKPENEARIQRDASKMRVLLGR